MLTLNEQIASCVYLECKGCKKLKARIPFGMYPDGRDIRYKDGEGKLWNGNTCRACDNEIKKAKKKAQRVQRKIVNAKRRERYARTGK